MPRLLHSLAIITLLTASIASAQPAATQPATSQPATTQPAATQPTDAAGWLDVIAHRAENIKTFRAKVRYDRQQILQGDEQRRFGTLLYIAGPPAQFKVHFYTLLVDGIPRKENQLWMFDGQWLVERHDDTKQFHKRQIVSPDADPKKVDPLALGDGPFSIPLKANREAIMKRFDVALAEPDEFDPKNTIHLTLTPKDPDSDFEQIDLWYSRDTLLPVKGESIHAGSGDVDVFNLLDPIQINSPVEENEIDTAAPSSKNERGWHEQITPWVHHH